MKKAPLTEKSAWLCKNGDTSTVIRYRMSLDRDVYDPILERFLWSHKGLDRKLMSCGLISFRRLVGVDGSIIMKICDETMAKCGANKSNCRVCLRACCSFSKLLWCYFNFWCMFSPSFAVLRRWRPFKATLEPWR